MSELGNIEMRQIETPVEQTTMAAEHSFSWRSVVAPVVATIAIAGCGSAEQGKSHTSAKPAETAAALTANDCNTANLNSYRANHVYGSPESEFPSLQHVVNGQETLLPLEQAKKNINEQLAGDPRVLALFSAYFLETRANLQEPNAATLDRAEQLTEFYMNNPAQAQQACEVATAQVDSFLESTDSLQPQGIALPRGQGFEIQADHDNTGEITRIHTEHVTAGLIDGYVLSYNRDDPSLTPEQKAMFEELKRSMVITGKGTIVIIAPIGQSGFNIESNNQQNKAPAHVVVTKHGKKILVTPAPNFHAPAGSGGQNSSVSGTTGGGNIAPGHTPENQRGPLNGPSVGPNKGHHHEATPGPGKTPQGGGSGGGGQGGGSHTGTTSTPPPVHTTPSGGETTGTTTSTPTTPSGGETTGTTYTPPPQTTTTSTQPKGPAPCNPNVAKC